MFTRHKFLLVSVKEWLTSALNYRSYPKNKTGHPFWTTLYIMIIGYHKRHTFSVRIVNILLSLPSFVIRAC